MIKITKDLGVHIKTLYTWIRAYNKEYNIEIGHSKVAKKSSSEESLDKENARLRKENMLHKQERDIY